MRTVISRGKRECILALACGLLLASCVDDESVPERQETVVRTVKVDFADYSRPVKLTGEVAANVTANLSFRAAGEVTEWHVDVGDHVTAGQLLARINPREQTSDVLSAEASVRGAEATVKQTSLSFERQKVLLSKSATTQELYDQARAALSNARASLDSAEARLGTARDAFSYTELHADANGIVTARNIETGQVVQTAQTVFTVARDGARDAVFQVYESLLFQELEDAKIALALVSDPSVQTTGTIREISPTINISTGTVRVKIALETTPDRMTLGAPVTGVARPKPAKQMILPWTSISAINNTPAVWVVDAQTRAVNLKPVTVASYEKGRALISSGLAKGDIVVIDGAKSLRPGEVVDLVQEQAQ